MTTDPDNPRRRIEILTFEGCPNHAGALELVERVLSETGVGADVELVDVPDSATAERLRFLGSPTILVDGRDIEPGSDARGTYSLACRIYATGDGLRGVPDSRWLAAALTDERPAGSAT